LLFQVAYDSLCAQEMQGVSAFFPVHT